MGGCHDSQRPVAATACLSQHASGHWIGAWSAAPSDVGDSFTDQTLRVIASPRYGGSTLRVRLSNRFGSQPISFAHATIGLQDKGPALVAESSRPLTFGCAHSVILAPGEETLSDPVQLSFKSFQNMAVSLHVGGSTGSASRHSLGLQTSYVAPSSAGDQAADETGAAFTKTTTSIYFLTSIDVLAPGSASAIVAFGDSITDGFVSSDGITITLDPAVVDQGKRYPDFLARRLEEAGLGNRYSVLNAGISGNRLLSDALIGFPSMGPSGLSRLDTDVLNQAGVSDVIVLIGTNDLGMAPPATSAEVIAGLKRLVDRLHAAGLKVMLATQTPCSGVVVPGGHGLPYAVAYRNEINDWVRKQSAADGVIDFDAALRDPANPDGLNPAFDSGDHLHPNPSGYEAMANAIDLALFRGGSRR